MKSANAVLLCGLMLCAAPVGVAAENAGVPALRSPKERADRAAAAQGSVQGAASVANPYKGGTQPRRGHPVGAGGTTQQQQ